MTLGSGAATVDSAVATPVGGSPVAIVIYLPASVTVAGFFEPRWSPSARCGHATTHAIGLPYITSAVFELVCHSCTTDI